MALFCEWVADCQRTDAWYLFNTTVSNSVEEWFVHMCTQYISRLCHSRVAWLRRRHAEKMQRRVWAGWVAQVKACHHFRSVSRRVGGEKKRKVFHLPSPELPQASSQEEDSEEGQEDDEMEEDQEEQKEASMKKRK